VRSGFNVDTGIPGSIALPDESDRKFYDAAKAGEAILKPETAVTILGKPSSSPRELLWIAQRIRCLDRFPISSPKKHHLRESVP
jgi:hypothetical protein